MRKKVLIFAEYYIPGIKGGGPIQSIKNLVDNLSDKIEFYILTSDRDMGDKLPYSNIKKDTWILVDKAKVLYTDIRKLNLFKLTKIINSSNINAIYLNSFFSYKLSISVVLLSKFKLIKPEQLILAPRGEFSPGAYGLKQEKKRMYITIAKKLGLYKGITWHATAENERKDIENIFGENVNIIIASNLTENYKNLLYDKNIEKSKGYLRIVFISRIHPIKNLKKAIEFLKNVNGKIEFNIYGPIEDKAYWSECETIIENLPKGLKVSYKGIVNHNMIMEIFKSHHVLLFPTLGENFGHVISEALIGGCPVIISDQTPWKNLKENNIGADLSLDYEDRFEEIIQFYINLDKTQYDILSENAFEYGKKTSNKEEDIKKTLDLFIQ
jgi:glycosyltransferase involved in cell wall biosynthesis